MRCETAGGSRRQDPRNGAYVTASVPTIPAWAWPGIEQ